MASGLAHSARSPPWTLQVLRCDRLAHLPAGLGFPSSSPPALFNRRIHSQMRGQGELQGGRTAYHAGETAGVITAQHAAKCATVHMRATGPALLPTATRHSWGPLQRHLRACLHQQSLLPPVRHRWRACQNCLRPLPVAGVPAGQARSGPLCNSVCASRVPSRLQRGG